METLGSLLVGRPLHIMAVALVFVVAHLLLRWTRAGSAAHPRALLVVAGAWTLYAAWEWLVQSRTPEADIRVDLLLIWPLLALVSIWFTIRALRSRQTASHRGH